MFDFGIDFELLEIGCSDQLVKRSFDYLVDVKVQAEDDGVCRPGDPVTE